MSNESLEERRVVALERIALHLGAIDSCVTKVVQMMAADRNIPCRHHDPSIEPWEKVFRAEHGKRTRLREILIGMPYKMRRKPPL